jgi:ABC-type sugar transport system substrate-binding protein
VQDAMGKKGQYDGIVMGAMDPNVLCKTLSKDAPAAGLPIVIINFPICGDDDYTAGTVGLSTSQSIHFFRNYLEWVYSTVPNGAKVGVITGPAEEGHTVQMKRALDEMKQKHPNVEVVQIVSGDYTAEAGLAETQTLLQGHSDLDMIISTYDQNTVGAVKALEASGKKPGEIKLWNLGGEKITRPMLADGWIEGTMYLDPVNETGQGFEMMVAHLEGHETPTFNDLSKGEVKLTKDTMNNFPEDF